MEFNIDFDSIKQATQREAQDAPLYASIDGRVAHLGGDEIVFFDPISKQNHVMTVQVLEAMDLCREFQPLEVHAQRVANELPGMQGQSQAVRKVLENLAARGLLLSDDAFMRRYEEITRRQLAEVSGIYIRACNRPQQVRRLLASLAAHHQRFPLPAPVILLADSTETAAAREHQGLIEHFNEVCPGSRYVGQEQWLQTAQGWSKQLANGEHLSAMLTRPAQYWGLRGGGIGKNLINLLSAGKRYILLDDDFVLPMAQHPEYRDGIQLTGSAWAVRTFDEIAQAAAAGEPLTEDPLALHLALCGQRLGPLLAQQPQLKLSRQSLRGTAPSRLNELPPTGRVVATVNGHRGNSGASGVAWLFLLDAEARKGWLANAERYVERRGDPAVFWACRRFQAGMFGTFTPFAVDNSELLPPTSPFGRGEDALFSALCRVLDPAAMQIDVPYAIQHLQESGRDRSELLGQAETPDVNHCLAELAREQAGLLHSDSPTTRLQAFAASLDDLAEASNETLQSYLTEFLTSRRSLLLQQLQTVAKSSDGMPEPWKADLIKLIEANGTAIIDRDAPRFSGWKESASADECCQAFRREAGVLSAGLRVWPQAWELAKNTAATGNAG